MIRVLIFVACLCSSASAFAQTCTPVGIHGTGEGLVWGQVGERIVWGGVVPSGRIWLVDNIGLATTDSRSLPYAIQRFHPNGHYVPVVGMAAAAGQVPGALGTPVAGWTGRLVLVAGSKVGGRVNAPDDFLQMAVLYTGWEFNADCLARVLGVEAPSSSTIISSPIDLAPLRAALTQIAANVQQVIASIPQP